ncbi:RAD50-interacting protein 1 [Battus philenor]|uniref:RAD50-interacting protein 1 n=1 Tax=Battus philenor TaxID=42288 RepID=UPI0035CE89DE
MKPQLSEDDKIDIINNLNIKIGADIYNLTDARDYEDELQRKKQHLEACIANFSTIHVYNFNKAPQLLPLQSLLANDNLSARYSMTIQKAERNSNQIEDLKTKSDKLKEKIVNFLNRTEPLRTELTKRFSTINRLEGALLYLKSFEKIEDLSHQMKQCRDDEQLVQLYGELKSMCNQYQTGHQGAYIKEYKHYWHNILKDNFTKHYEDVLKSLKWPFISSMDNSPASKEVMLKFSNITKYLFLIQEPEDLIPISTLEDLRPGSTTFTCLPMRILLRPLKKRFMFHFTGSRQTARIDRPEWFLTQTLTWIKDHRTFVNDYVQPIADKLELVHINAVDEFNNGVISFAAERLHTVLGLYITQGQKGEIVDVDAAFAHAVDETLGFHRELQSVTGYPMNMVLHVLTKAEHFIRWIAVEKRYALSKMDEALGSEQWSEPVAAGVEVAVGTVLWVPRSADWFIALLKTIEDRYSMLPEPGHRLQFLELQLELIEEWRIRLTQLMAAANSSVKADTFLIISGPHPLTAVINASHYTRTVLLQWAHSLHYLQLHFYRRQFEYFTRQQHKDESSDSSTSSGSDNTSDEGIKEPPKTDDEIRNAMSINELDFNSKMMALNEISRKASTLKEPPPDFELTVSNKSVNTELPSDTDQAEEAGVFGEAPGLLAHLRDSGLASLSEHILLEFSAAIHDYKMLKWHAMMVVEEKALTVSASLCGPLSALCARVAAAEARLAPALTARLRANLAAEVDQYLLRNMVLSTWFNTGGTMQFTYDVKRNLLPALAPPSKTASQLNLLPNLTEACKLLNLDYEDARRLQSLMSTQRQAALESLYAYGIVHIHRSEAQKILSQRTDLNDSTSPSSVMELF